MALVGQIVDRLADQRGIVGMQPAFGIENVVMHVERCEILPIITIMASIARSRMIGIHSSGCMLRSFEPNSASAPRRRHQIIARIKALGNLADRLSERLAVAQEDRTGEHVDLRAGIVDVNSLDTS